jgi:hypothetical protein
MELDIIMLSKISQAQKDKFLMFSLIGKNLDFKKGHRRTGTIWEKERDQRKSAERKMGRM